MCGAVWMGTQALWLAEAYKLEFLGEDVFFGLSRSGVCFMSLVIHGYLGPSLVDIHPSYHATSTLRHLVYLPRIDVKSESLGIVLYYYMCQIYALRHEV
jgi:hypothetical protein